MSVFERETRVRHVDGGLYRGELHRGWRAGKVPVGGYVLAVAGQALRQALPHRDPLSVNAFYLAPTLLGPVDCRVEVLRTGRSTSFATVQMLQEGELKVQVTAAFTDLDRLQGESWEGRPAPELPAWEACEMVDRRVEFAQRVERRFARGGEVFKGEAGAGDGQFEGWVQHCDGADPDPISLLLFADIFPPPMFTVFGVQRWVPTVELTVQVRARPAPGPLKGRFYSRHLTRGVVEEDGEFWDSEGQLVCVSRQTAKIRIVAQ